MEISLNEIIIACIGIVSGAGFWGYLSNRASLRMKQEHEKEQALVKHLLDEIEQLKDKVDILIQDKEDLLLEIATLRSELAAAKAELHAMTSALRYGRFKRVDQDEF